MYRHRFIQPFVLLLIFALPSLSSAQQIFQSKEQQTQLIEMFSSQGCSSCPPAQAYINTFKNTDILWKDVIPVVFHVDYWDYLGWKDPYSSAHFSARQRAFSKEGLVKSVYTPGFVVNGKEWRGFFKKQPRPEQTNTPGILTLTKEGSSLSVKFDGQVPENAQINIALLGLNIKTQVRSGENARRELPEEFIVIGFASHPFIQDAQTKSSIHQYAMPKHKTDAPQAIAAWITKANGLEPIQATGGLLNNIK